MSERTMVQRRSGQRCCPFLLVQVAALSGAAWLANAGPDPKIATASNPAFREPNCAVDSGNKTKPLGRAAIAPALSSNAVQIIERGMELFAKLCVICHGDAEAASYVEVTVNYQTVTRHYIEALRDGNMTDNWGEILYQLWLETNKGAPVSMTAQELALTAFGRGDSDSDSDLNLVDFDAFSECLAGPAKGVASCTCLDFGGESRIDMKDYHEFQNSFTGL